MIKVIRRWIRQCFCKNELQGGRILIIWKDVDNIVYGWNCNADREELALMSVGKIMRNTKRKKLEQITGISKKSDDGEYLYPLEDEDDSPSPPY